MGEPHNFKRGADGDKGGHNPINRRTEEFICVVGSCSNTFNGYMYVDPAVNQWVPCKEPDNVVGVPAYINGPPGNKAYTHDVYWANFIDPAIKLFNNKVAQPKPGDIVTLMVFMPGYLKRQKVDWEASPYNTELHQYSPWVRDNPEYDPYARSGEPPAKVTPVKAKDRPPSGSSDSEAAINHDILMRKTSANGSDGILKRSVDGQDFIAYIHNLPRRVVYGESLGGTARLPDVLVKVLVFNAADQLVDYLKTGNFAGAKYWKNPLDQVSEEDTTGVGVLNEDDIYYDAALQPSSKQWAARWKRLLKAAAQPPSVDRSKVKIRRFDYIGHSDANSFYLLYGWGNKKGELPNKEGTLLSTEELSAGLPKKNVTGNAFAQLWGCHQGTTMAPALADRFTEVVACEGSTLFDHILDSASAMPQPEYGSDWKHYKK